MTTSMVVRLVPAVPAIGGCEPFWAYGSDHIRKLVREGAAA